MTALQSCRTVASVVTVLLLLGSGFAGLATAEEFENVVKGVRRLPFDVLVAQRAEDNPTLQDVEGAAVSYTHLTLPTTERV